MNTANDIPPVFLNISRVLLADRPLFAQLSASLAKVARNDLKGVFALSFKDGRPFLQYHQDRLLDLANDAPYLADILQEELLHLLLQHPMKQADYPFKWAFYLAADLEVWQYLTVEVQAIRFSKLIQRLQLPSPWQLDTLYNRLIQLEQAHGRDQLHYWQMSSPLTLVAHQYWQPKWSINKLDLWHSWLQQETDLLMNLFPENTLWRQLNVSSDELFQVNWKVILQRFAHNDARTILRTSHRRPSKRYGTFPGTRRKREQKLIVIIDTSGSVEDAMLSSFFRQLQILHRQQIRITIVESDYKVRQSYIWTGRVPQLALGGGYTDFNPALAYANASDAYDGIVYFTDGKANRPSIIPEWPLLWIITDDTSDKDWSTWPGIVVIKGVGNK